MPYPFYFLPESPAGPVTVTGGNVILKGFGGPLLLTGGYAGVAPPYAPRAINPTVRQKSTKIDSSLTRVKRR